MKNYLTHSLTAALVVNLSPRMDGYLVLPSGEFPGMIPEPLCVYSESVMANVVTVF